MKQRFPLRFCFLTLYFFVMKLLRLHGRDPKISKAVGGAQQVDWYDTQPELCAMRQNNFTAEKVVEILI